MRSVAAAATTILVCSVAALCQTPTINAGGVQNSAGSASSGAISPGSLVTIFGSNLASSMAISDTAPLSTTVGGVGVTIGGMTAPVLSVSGNQINVQASWSTPTSDTAGPAAVVVTSNGTASAAVTVTVAGIAPAIYNMGGQAIALNGDGTLAAPANSIPGINTHPSVINDPGGLVLFVTGLGPVSSTIADGANSSDAMRNTSTMPTVTIGGMPAVVTFSGLSPQFVGMNQLNVTIPPGTPTGSAVPVQITVNNITSNLATIAVSN